MPRCRRKENTSAQQALRQGEYPYKLREGEAQPRDRSRASRQEPARLSRRGTWSDVGSGSTIASERSNGQRRSLDATPPSWWESGRFSRSGLLRSSARKLCAYSRSKAATASCPSATYQRNDQSLRDARAGRVPEVTVGWRGVSRRCTYSFSRGSPRDRDRCRASGLAELKNWDRLTVFVRDLLVWLEWRGCRSRSLSLVSSNRRVAPAPRTYRSSERPSPRDNSNRRLRRPGGLRPLPWLKISPHMTTSVPKASPKTHEGGGPLHREAQSSAPPSCPVAPSPPSRLAPLLVVPHPRDAKNHTASQKSNGLGRFLIMP